MSGRIDRFATEADGIRVAPPAPRPTGLERLESMTPEEQDAALGKATAEAWRRGEVTLDELVARDTIHGERVITQKPLEEV